MTVPVDLEATVLRNDPLSSDYQVLTLDARDVAARALPGQFVMIKAGPGTDPLLRRPFSIFEILRDAAGAPTALTLLIKRVGPATARLYDLRPGDHVNCLGPLGNGFTVVPSGDAWMVAGGVGLAPFAELAVALRAARVPATLYYGGRTDRDLFHLDWFRARDIRLELATEDGSVGTAGRITVPLARDLAAAPADRTVTLYACGPEPMLKAVAALAAAHGRACQVSTERIMGCGLGGCYSCVVRIRDGSPQGHFVRSCVNGPVFAGESIIWE